MAPRIRCFYVDCAFISEGNCSAPSIEMDPEDGCLTFTEDLDDGTYNLDTDDLDYSDDDWDEAGFEEVDEEDLDEEH